MPDETLAPEDDVNTAVAPATPMSDLDHDWICDFDGARLEVYGRHQVGDITYQKRVCSADPNHIKLQPV